MRLDKFLCDTLNMTRSEAKKAIGAGRVSVDGTVVKSAAVHVDGAEVILDNNPVCYRRYFYIMLHKPTGYVCANRDSRSKTVFDLLPPEYRKKDLFVCGRLDKDTTGFVLITNNGDLAHRLLAPKKDVFKEYLVTLRDKVSKEDTLKLQSGIVLADGLHCKPAFFEQESARFGVLRISEGKFHQIKRMFAALGNEVVGLHRRSIHGLTLDPSLKEGECRYLTEDEIILLQNVE
jgi:16S rRNA pseudouridine516 synthase